MRELAQWIRDTLMLTLADAVFDREDPSLLPPAGASVTCPKRTGANTALFDDFFQDDDRCLSALCFHQKVEAHIARQKQNIEGLIQIARVHYTNGKGEELIGHIESFNGRLRDECLNANWFTSLGDARRKIEAWRKDYNENRPHSALNYRTPAEFARAAGPLSFPLLSMNKVR